MGCVSAKQPRCQECHQHKVKLENMVQSYQSIYDYIQRLRQDVFDSLLQDATDDQIEDLALQETEVVSLDSITNDLNVFRRMKQLNKYKHDLVVSKFKKNMQECVIKIQSIEEINFKAIDELNAFRDKKTTHTSCSSNSPTHSKQSLLSNEFQAKVNHLHKLISQLNTYLEEQNEDPVTDYGPCNFNTTEMHSQASKRLSVCQQISIIQLDHSHKHPGSYSPTHI